MCIVDSSLLVSRRSLFGSALAAGVVLGATDLGKSLFFPGVAEGAEQPAKNGGPGQAAYHSNGSERTVGRLRSVTRHFF
jgi:hypothetical protein